jgi:diguanylate cyclase
MSNQGSIELGDIHWLMDILQNIDVGLVVLDKEYRIQLWNGFMESHSGLSPQSAKGQNLFSLFPDISEHWFRQKTEPVFQLKTRTFTIWEQRPYLFHFKNYRPITGMATFMYQNTAMIPLESITRSIDHICLIIYDVTDIAVSRRSREITTVVSNSIVNNPLPLQTEPYADTPPGLPENSSNPRQPLIEHTRWQQNLAHELARCSRSEQPGCLVCLQISHPEASPAQQMLLVELLNRTLRQSDCASQNGGILFTLLTNSDEGDALFFVERVRKLIKRLPDDTIGLTLASGIARYLRDFESAEDWQLAAEEALLQARQQGGDCNRVFEA